MTASKNNNLSLIRRSEELIKSFNPTTHSIDTHLIEHLGDTSDPKTTSPENMFIQQVVTGWFREKKTLDAFISNFYGDNGARITRTDMIMYTLLTYLCLFRLKELGFPKFKELASQEDPSKVACFVEYLFNKECLWSSLRDGWMKVVDLTFTEEVLIGGIEKFLPQSTRYLEELDGAAAGVAAAEAAKEEAKKNGTAGMGATLRKSSTRPRSPKLTKPRPPILPEPERIDGKVTANEIPSYLNNTTMETIAKTRKETHEEVRKSTMDKYSGSKEFQFNETKSGKKIEVLRAEVEAERARELQFDATFVHDAPDFTQKSAVVRVNAATILREDFLYRKQQNKDAAVLKNYEEELRDPVEYFAWQQEMREQDHKDKLDQIVMRRAQAREGSVQAAMASATLLKDNKTIAKLVRQQANQIKEKKEVEVELETLNRQLTVSKTIEVRDNAPAMAVEKVTKARISQAARNRVELHEMIMAKEAQDKIDEEIQADKIRQLRAINSVHRENIKVFDPTQQVGPSLLNNMSYMEMKERVVMQKSKFEVEEMNKRSDILESKQKRAMDLQRRADSVLKARLIKAEAFQSFKNDKANKEISKKVSTDKLRETKAVELEGELRHSRIMKQEYAANLIAEQERIARAQAYLGAAAGQVEEENQKQLQMARERKMKMMQTRDKYEAIAQEESKQKDKQNVLNVHKQRGIQAKERQKQQQAEVDMEKRVAVRKIKGDVIYKKTMAQTSRAQAEKTLKVRQEFNPYAESMRDESITKGRSYMTKRMTGTPM